MTIDTKFDIGDKVFCINVSEECVSAFSLIIDSIYVRKDGVTYLDKDADEFSERDIFATIFEALDAIRFRYGYNT